VHVHVCVCMCVRCLYVCVCVCVCVCVVFVCVSVLSGIPFEIYSSLSTQDIYCLLDLLKIYIVHWN